MCYRPEKSKQASVKAKALKPQSKSAAVQRAKGANKAGMPGRMAWDGLWALHNSRTLKVKGSFASVRSAFTRGNIPR